MVVVEQTSVIAHDEQDMVRKRHSAQCCGVAHLADLSTRVLLQKCKKLNKKRFIHSRGLEQ